MSQRSDVPRVAMLRHTLFLRSEVFIPDQASKLAASVTLVARDRIVNPRDDLAVTSFAGSPVARFAYTFGYSVPLYRCLRNLEPQIVHAHFGVEGLYSLSSARRLDVPHVATLHGSEVSLTRRAFIAARKPALARYALLRSNFFKNPLTMFVCVSRHVQRLAVQLGAEPERTLVIPTGVDTRRIAPVPQPDSPVIVHVARLVPVKGTATLLRAMAQVVARLPDAHLRIIGDGPLRAGLTDLANRLGIAKSVTFTGALPHPAVLGEIAAARVLAAPSETAPSGAREGLGQAPLEAGAMGRPVVATANGGLTEAVADGVSGILVNERNPGELAEALVTILADRNLSESLGRNAAAFVQRNFDLVHGAELLDKLYGNLLHS